MVVLCLLSAVVGHANTFNFYTPNGAVAGLSSDPVADRITFITGLNTIEIRMTNLELNIFHETQAIASLEFFIQGFTTQPQPTGITLQTNLGADPNLGYVVNFPTQGSAVFTTAALTSVTNRWQIASAASTQVLSGSLQINVFSGGSPSQLILGQGPYGAVNNALTGHDPYLTTNTDDYISFKLAFAPAAKITAATNIATGTGKFPVVDFGTTFATTQELVLTDQPEPGTVALMLGGLGLICLGRWRRRKSQP